MEAVARLVTTEVPDAYLRAVAEREYQEKLLGMVRGGLGGCWVYWGGRGPGLQEALVWGRRGT